MQTKMQAMSKQNVGCARQMQKVSAIPSRPVQQRKSVKVNTASKDVVLNASSFMNPGQVLNRQILEPPSWELPQSAHRISEGLNPKQGRLRVFSGTSNQPLAAEVADYLGLELGKIKVKRFADGEVYVQMQESFRGCDVFLVQPTCPPLNDSLMELTESIRGCDVFLVQPTCPPVNDSLMELMGRESIAAKLTANMITVAGADRVLAMDLHSGQCVGYFDIPVDHVHGDVVVLDYLASKRIPTGELVVVSPDVGGVSR
eukprot:gene4865-34625_t